MNFYKHHIGDYAQATSHLSFIEDAAYVRCLRKYYAEEVPLPADVKSVQRLIGARSREEREAVQTILEEFFTLEDDGWHNKRADAELIKAIAQANTNRLIAEEREARRRGREQANESSTKRVTGVHESLHESSSSREPSQTPDSRLQTPDSKEEAHASSARGRVGKALKAGGMDLVRVNLSDPRLTALIDQGATPDEFEGIAREAVAGNKGFAWVLAVLQSRRAEAATITLAPKPGDGDAWHETRSGIEARGEALGLGTWDEQAFQQGRGEQWPTYRNRVFKAAGHAAMERVA